MREIARAETEHGELVLRERLEGGAPVLELRANGLFVMDTRETASERALARAGLALVDDAATVLVGGLGLGFTVQEVLADPRVRRCVVVEIEQRLVDWMRDGTVPHGPGVLADARLSVVVADVAAALAEARTATYDLVLLDVDNGPANLVHATNAALYDDGLLGEVHRVLRPGGVVVVWSADEAPDLERRLGGRFADVASQPHQVLLGERPAHYWLVLGRRDPAS